MGITKSNSTIAIDVLYSINKKNIESKKTKRYFFVPNPVKIKISGTPRMKAELPLHPSENIGTRVYETMQEFYIPKQDEQKMKKESGNYRLMHLLNFKTDKFSALKPRDFHFISREPDKKLKPKFLQWIPADDENEKKNFKTIIRMPDNSVIEGITEPAVEQLKNSDVIQFERFGFVCLHTLDKKSRTAEFWFAHE
jgi:glutamyl-tRNA synthetase